MPVFPSVWPLLIIIYTLHQCDPWDTHFGANTLPVSRSLALCENVGFPNVNQFQHSSFNQVISHLTLLCLLFEFPSLGFEFPENVISCAHANSCEHANSHVTQSNIYICIYIHIYIYLSASLYLSLCLSVSLYISISLSLTHSLTLSLLVHLHLSSHLHVLKDLQIISSTRAYTWMFTPRPRAASPVGCLPLLFLHS